MLLPWLLVRVPSVAQGRGACGGWGGGVTLGHECPTGVLGAGALGMCPMTWGACRCCTGRVYSMPFGDQRVPQRRSRDAGGCPPHSDPRDVGFGGEEGCAARLARVVCLPPLGRAPRAARKVGDIGPVSPDGQSSNFGAEAAHFFLRGPKVFQNLERITSKRGVLDQVRAQASYTPPFWDCLRSTPQDMVSDV